jgi:uncharacterized repeat protein (TIGR01451 family)
MKYTKLQFFLSIGRVFFAVCFFVTFTYIPLSAQSENQPLTQAAFIVQLVKAMHVEYLLPENPSIQDYVKILEAKNITIPGGYKPDDYITTKQMAIMLVPVIGMEKSRYRDIKNNFGQSYIDKALIVDVVGQVQYKLSNTDEWLDAKPGILLGTEDTIKTEKESKVLLRVGQISIVTIKEKTVLKLFNLSNQPILYIEQGEIIFDTHEKEHRKAVPYYVITPTTLTGVRGTIFAKIVRFDNVLKKWITIEKCFDGKLREYLFAPDYTYLEVIEMIMSGRLDNLRAENWFNLNKGSAWEENVGLSKISESDYAKTLSEVNESRISSDTYTEGEIARMCMEEEGLLSEELTAYYNCNDSYNFAEEMLAEVEPLPASEVEGIFPSSQGAPGTNIPLEEDRSRYELPFPDVQLAPSPSPTPSPTPPSPSPTPSPTPAPSPTITTTSLPNGTEGVPYSQALSASGGTTPYTWTLTAGALPAGLSFSTGGVISGTPTLTISRGTYSLTFQVTDSNTNSASTTLSLKIGYNKKGVDDYVWVTCRGINYVNRITKTDPPTITIAPITWAGATAPTGVAVDDENVWVTNSIGGIGTVTRIGKDNPLTDIEPITVGGSPTGIAVDDQYVWVSNAPANQITRINKANHADIVPIVTGQTSPYGIAVDNQYVWVANSTSHTLTRITKTDLSNVSGFIGVTPIGVAVDNQHVWVTHGTDVERVDNKTGAPPWILTTTNIPFSGLLGITVDNTHVYVADGLNASVVRINKSEPPVVTGNPPVGAQPYGMALDDQYVWCSRNTNAPGNMTRIKKSDLSTNDTPVGDNPWNIGDATGYSFDQFFTGTYVDPNITGTVYDSSTGEKVEGVITSIYQEGSSTPLATCTTNPYSFGVIDGYYYLRAEKAGYTFPSNKKNGVTPGDHGEVFYASGTKMTIDLPMDQGYPLEITKTANKKTVVNGDIITYDVKIRNNSMWDMLNVNVIDEITNGFKYVEKSAYVDNTQFPVSNTQISNRIATFKLTNVPGHKITHFTYQVRVGSGISPGTYKTKALTWDRVRDWQMSNETSCEIDVVADALFTLGTIIGKVFYDLNENGIQDKGENGIPNVTLATEYGVVVETDKDGKYHIPAVPPGTHLVKVNSATLPIGSVFTSENPYMVKITEGLLAKVNFGVVQRQNSSTDSSVAEKEGNANTPLTHPSPLRGEDKGKGFKQFLNQFFIVALGEGIVRNVNTSGNIEMVNQDDRFDDGVNVDGKLALYLKGKIKGKYLVTASLDTDRRPSRRGKMYQLHKLFTNLDPDKYYPVYGDASKINYEANDTQDELFLLVEWDESHIKWGSFETDIPLYNRTLQGAHAVYQSVKKTKFGDPYTKINAFFAKANQVAAHDEFLGTGGSLYYLRHTPVIEGSEKIQVELKDQVSKQTIGTAILVEEMDYEIDYDTGRILLKKPLSSVNYNYNNSIISNDILSGSRAYLIVNYEYESNSTMRKEAYGIKASQQIGNHFQIGGTYVEEEKESKYYRLMGGDATARLNRTTALTAEYNRSEETQLAGSYSIDGGLTDSTLSDTANDDKSGSSFNIRGNTRLFNNTDINAGYTRQDPNFSATDTISTQGTDIYTASILTRLKNNLALGARHVTQEIKDALLSSDLIGDNKVHTTTALLDYLPNRWDMRLEYQHQSVTNPFIDFTYEGYRQMMDHDIVAARAGYKVTDRLHPYVGGQGTVQGYVNNQVYAGVEYRIWDKTNLNVKETVGNLGNSTLVGLTSQITPETEAYTNIEVGNNAQNVFDNSFNQMESGNFVKTSVGQKTQIDNNGSLTWQKDYSSWQSNVLNGELVGYETKLSDTLAIGLSYERAQIEKEPTAISRDSGSIALTYLNVDTLKAFSKLELREDRGSDTKRQWLTQNNILYQLNEDISAIGRANWSVTDNRTEDLKDAEFHEMGIGLAYRPVEFDRLNLLAKYSYITNLMPESQNDFSQTTNDIRNIYAIEGAFDVCRYLQLVGKFAMRDMDEKVGPRDWTASQTYLYIARLNFHVTNKWDIAGEYRTLANRQIEDSKSGWLIEIDREIIKYARLGVGYNFTDYDDDLANNDNYDSGGWFVRVNGKY